MNIKLRLKNKAVLAALIAAVVSCVYTMLSALGIVPALSEDAIMGVVATLLDLLVILGVVTDPTTAGVKDSERAMGYEEPYKDEPVGDMNAEEIEEE